MCAAVEERKAEAESAEATCEETASLRRILKQRRVDEQRGDSEERPAAAQKRGGENEEQDKRGGEGTGSGTPRPELWLEEKAVEWEPVFPSQQWTLVRW